MIHRETRELGQLDVSQISQRDFGKRRRKPFEEMLPYGFSLVKMLIQHGFSHKTGVVIDIGQKMVDCGHDPKITRQSVSEEVRRLDLVEDEHVIAEIDKPLGKPFDPVEIEFDGIAVESGHVLGRNDIPVVKDDQFRVPGVHPPGRIRIGDEIHLVDPGCILLDPAEQIMQHIPAAIPVHAVIDGTTRLGRIILILPSPFRVVVTAPGYDKINPIGIRIVHIAVRLQLKTAPFRQYRIQGLQQKLFVFLKMANVFTVVQANEFLLLMHEEIN